MRIQVNGIEVNLERRNVKNMNIYVKPPDGHVLVTVPRRVSQKQAEAFIASREAWILQAKEQIAKRISEETAEEEITQADIRQLQGWIEKYAAKWEPVLGVHCEKWTIRKMKTRWGSCSVDKHTIRINAKLALREEKLAELVIVHELVHLLVPAHDHHFYAYLASCIPDWRKRQDSLRGRSRK